MVLTDQGIRAFDCLEFDKSLRTIDPWCDAAFLVMDCCVRDRADLAYAVIDGYLDHSGDYEGVLLLPLYSRYRSMVRAKVAALQLESSYQPVLFDALKRHVDWTWQNENRPPGRLIVTCGVSGSGKSFWALKLVPELNAVRLRSDVLRKRRHGLAPNADSQSSLGSKLYASEETKRLYEQLATIVSGLLCQGENVVVARANLKLWQRQLFYAAASAADSPCIVLYFTASKVVLEQRIAHRQAQGNDASEANLDVLNWQLSTAELPLEDEPVANIDSEHISLAQILEAIRGNLLYPR